MGAYVFTNAALLGAFALMAVHYAVLWWPSRREETSLLVFSLHNVWLGAYTVSVLGLSMASTVASAQTFLNLRSTVGPLIMVTGAWLAASLAGLRARRFLVALTITFCALVLANQFTPLAGQVTKVLEVSLPWGERVSAVEHTHPVGLVAYVLVFTSVIFVCLCAGWLWRRDRLGGALLGTAGALQLVMCFMDFALDVYGWPMPYPGAVAYALWALLISTQIGRRHRRDVEALRESEERHRLTLQEVQDHAIFMLDPGGRVTSWNEGAQRVSGYEAEEVLGKDNALFYLPEDVRIGLPEQTLIRAREQGSYSSAGWRVRKDKSRIWTEGSITALFGPHRTLLGFTVVTRDRTSLKRSEAVWRSVVDATAEGVITVDDQWCMDFVNSAAANMFGYAPSELAGRPVSVILPQLDTALLAPQPGVASASPDRELEGVRNAGSRFPVELGASEWSFDTRRYHTLLIRDVTHRKSLESQLRHSQKMEALGRLAGGVAHDFNNLLTVISGYSHALLAQQEDGKTHSAAEQICEAADRASALTRQLLAFSRRSVLETKELDLNKVVRSAEGFLRRLIGEDIELVISLYPQPCLVRADADQLGQVLMNLAVNARDAMPTGGSLTIATGLSDAFRGEPGRYVTLSVADDGIGMSPEIKTRIFEPFFTTKEAGAGTGLGLSVVHGIVEQSGGAIDVSSEPGQGTTFLIHLPAARAQGKQALRQEPTKLPPPGHATVMLVEDDEGVRTLLLRTLEDGGYRVVCAKNGDEARRMLQDRNQHIDVLLTDLVMPGISGRELADSLQRANPEVPVLFTSGYTEDTVMRHGISEGAVNFLRKPFTPDALRAKLAEVLGNGKRPLQQETRNASPPP